MVLKMEIQLLLIINLIFKGLNFAQAFIKVLKLDLLK